MPDAVAARTVGVLLWQATVKAVSGCPLAPIGRTATVAVLPTRTRGNGGSSCTSAGGVGRTVTRTESFLPSFSPTMYAVPALTPETMPVPDPLTVATEASDDRNVTIRRLCVITLPSFRSDWPTTAAAWPPAKMVDGVTTTVTRSTSGTPVIHEHPASARPAAAEARVRATRGPTGRRPPAGEGTKYRMLLRKLR